MDAVNPDTGSTSISRSEPGGPSDVDPDLDPSGRNVRRAWIVCGWVVAALAIAGLVAASVDTPSELNTADAVLLGVIEGVTEFLPISSTGHLTVTQRLLGIGDTDVDRAAADAYAIVIQSGAILAVLVLYRQRIGSLASGLIGRDENGRQLLVALIASMAPAATVGLLLGDSIKEHLFGVGPVATAWIVGAAAILVLVPRWRGGARQIESLSARDGLIIGLAQALALWPGVSRSLVTILAALALGFAIHAAVEYSFLLGLGTLGAATAYEGLSSGDIIIDTFGVTAPVVGFLAAFCAAVVAIRWMVAYLETHSLAIFAWYRFAVGAAAFLLLATGAV